MAIQTAADNQVTVLSASWNNGSTAYTAFKLDVNSILTPPSSVLFDVGTNTGTYSSKFVINVSGSVGIGVTTPPSLLSIDSASSHTVNDLVFTFDSAGNYRNGISNNMNSGNLDGNKMMFNVCNTSTTVSNLVMTLTGRSRVGIGDTAPAYKFVVGQGETTQTGQMFIAAQLNSSGKGLVIDTNTRTATDNSVLALEIINNSNGNTLAATVAGDVGVGITNPSSRLHVAGGDIRFNSGYGIIGATNTAGNVLRADGTRFVPSQLSYSDLSTTNLPVRTVSYSSITGASGDWYPIFKFGSSNTTGALICTLSTAAHSSVTFAVNRGYPGSNLYSISVLNCVLNPNGGFPYVTELRIIADSNGTYDAQVEAKLLWSSGPTTIVTATVMASPMDVVFAASLATTAAGSATPGVSDSVVLSNNMMRAKGNIITPSRVGIGTTDPGYKLHVSGGSSWLDNASGDNATRAIGLTVSTLPGSNFSAGSDPGDAIRTLSVIAKGSTRPAILTLRNMDNNTAFYDFVADGNTGKLFIQRYSASPALMLDTNNNTGISTSTASARLHVQGSTTTTTPTLLVKESQAMANATATLDVQNSAGTSLFFVSGSGNVGIGSASPSYKLDVNGIIRTNSYLTVDAGNSSDYYSFYYKASTTGLSGRVGYFNAGNSTGWFGVETNLDNSTSSGFYVKGLAASNPAFVVNTIGNAGIGTTGADWNTGYRGLMLAKGFSVMARDGSDVYISQNAIYDTSNQWKYTLNVASSQLFMYNGSMIFNRAGIGTTGGVLTWAESMRIDASGNVGINTTTILARLHVSGSATASDQTVLIRAGTASQTGPVLEVENNIGTTLMVVSGSGYVGIGSATPSATLNVLTADIRGVTIQTGTNSSGDLDTREVMQFRTTASTTGLSFGAGDARLLTLTATSDNQVVWRANRMGLIGSEHVTLQTAGTEAVRIDSSQRVGIGLTNPSNKLVVTTSTQFDGIFLTNSGGFTPARLVGTTASNDGGALILRNVSTDTVTINGNGDSYFNSSNVGIGTNSPATKLDVWGYTRIGNYGGTFQGLTVLNNNNSALLETVSFVDFQNDLGVTDSNVFAGHATNGSSYLALGTTPAGSRSSDRRAERVRINGDGRVGIGTASPATYLHMHVTASLDGMLLTDGSRFIRMMAGTAGAGAYNNIVLPNDHALIFSGSKATLSQEGFVIAPWDNTVGAGVTSGLRMNPSGSVSIGASTSSGRFFVSGSGNSNETVAVLKSGTPTATRVLDVQNVAGNSILSVFPTPTVNVPGAVGINTTPSNGVLEVYGGAGNVYTVSNAGSNVVAGFSGITNSSSTSAISIFSIDTTNGVLIGSQTAQNASLITSNTIGLTLDTSQRTGVGTTTISTARMHVQGTSTGSDTTLRVRHNVANGSNLPVLDVQNSAGTSLLFVSGSGRVGIGSTSPGAPLDIVGGSTSAPVFPSLRLRQSVNNGYGFIQLGDSSTNSNNWHIGSEGDGRFLFYNGAFGSGTERLRLTNSTGDLTIATGNLVIGTAGKGIDFGATPPASSGSLGQELFDDYEEGAFTPGLAVGGGGSITTSTAAGTYTKMGRVVVCRFFFEASAVSGTRNTLQITGFPFQMDVTYANCFLELYNLNNAATGLTGNFAHGVGWASAPSNRLNVSIYLRTSGIPLGGLNETPANAFQANTIMAGVVTYFTNQ